jgi:hypothetical protein
MSEDRRCKIIRVSTAFALKALGFALQPGDTQDIVVLDAGLPPGLTVQAVNYDPAWDCFVFRVWHPSFDVVPEGQPLPVVDAVKVHVVNVDRPVKGDDGVYRPRSQSSGRRWL